MCIVFFAIFVIFLAALLYIFYKCIQFFAQYKKAVREAATLCPRPKVDRKRLALGGGVEYGVVHINYVVTWTSNQSGLATLTIDLLTFKVVSESRVTWSTAVPIIVFLGLSVLDLDPIYATDRQIDRRQTRIIA